MGRETNQLKQKEKSELNDCFRQKEIPQILIKLVRSDEPNQPDPNIRLNPTRFNRFFKQSDFKKYLIGQTIHTHSVV